MAKYMRSSEQLKNGYMLHDVLGTTCYVYGNADIYDCFLNQCQKNKQTLQGEILREQQYDLLRSVENAEFHGDCYIDVKKKHYRPITVLLHVLANHFNLTHQSSFSILNDLKRKDVIDPIIYDELVHAVAITLEIRMRFYQTRNGQRNAIELKDLNRMMGTKRMVHLEVANNFLRIGVMDLMYRAHVSREDCTNLRFPRRDSDIRYSVRLNYERSYREDRETLILYILGEIKNLLQRYETKKILPVTAYQFIIAQIQALHESSIALRRSANPFPNVRDFSPNSDRIVNDLFEWSCEILCKFEPGTQYFINMTAILFSRKQYLEANIYLDQCVMLELSLNRQEHPDLDAVAGWELELKFAILSPREAVKYFEAAASGRRNLTHFTKALYTLGVIKGRILCGPKEYDPICQLITLKALGWQINSQTHLLKPLQYRMILSYICNLLTDNYGGAHAMEFSRSIINMADKRRANDVKPLNDLGPVINSSAHYKYDYGMIRNTGKHANFTFVKSDYTMPLVRKEVEVKFHHALQIISSVSYGDMLMLIEYSMKKTLRYQAVPLKSVHIMVKCTEGIVLMAVCENIRASDHSLFIKLLDSSSDFVKKAILLQPFIYACLKEFSARSWINRPMIMEQNDICKRIFLSSSSVDDSFKAAVSDYTNFKFHESTKKVWKMLQRATCAYSETKTKFFLVCTLTIMIERKRERPLPHLRKCRELSLVHGSLWEMSTQKASLFEELLEVSKFYALANSSLEAVYNLAVNVSVFDFRKCCALIWKLIHTRKLRHNLLQRCVLLLIDTVDTAYGDSINHGFEYRL